MISKIIKVILILFVVIALINWKLNLNFKLIERSSESKHLTPNSLDTRKEIFEVLSICTREIQIEKEFQSQDTLKLLGWSVPASKRNWRCKLKGNMLLGIDLDSCNIDINQSEKKVTISNFKEKILLKSVIEMEENIEESTLGSYEYQELKSLMKYCKAEVEKEMLKEKNKTKPNYTKLTNLLKNLDYELSIIQNDRNLLIN